MVSKQIITVRLSEYVFTLPGLCINKANVRNLYKIRYQRFDY